MNRPRTRPRSERLAVLYLQLVGASTRRGPTATRVRLLLLAALHASESGWTEEADTCRELVLSTSPHHLIGRFATFADAALSDEFQALVRQLQRQCPQEMADHLATRQQVDVDIALREPPRLVARDLIAELATALDSDNA